MARGPGRRIYLDHHATTPVDPRVLEAMLPCFTVQFGNPASRNHVFGWEAERLVEAAREVLAAGIGARPREIVFTSGATEANNLAILGVARALRERGRHLVCSAVEHPSVLDPLEALEREGWEVTRVGVDRHGRVDPEAVATALRPDTVLVSVMHANNEVGTLQPLAAIGALCAERGVLLHSDATQSLGREPVEVQALGVHLLSASAHKLHGPKGIGFLYIRERAPRVPVEPILHGGGHERGRRSGTLNVPGIVGFARALELALEDREAEQARIRALRDHLQERLVSGAGEVVVHGHPRERLAGNLNLAFLGVEAEPLLAEVEGIAASTGSACSSARLRPSHVLEAMGVPPELARGSLRLGLGRGNTRQEVDEAAERILEAVARLRERSPRWRMRHGPQGGDPRPEASTSP